MVDVFFSSARLEITILFLCLIGRCVLCCVCLLWCLRMVLLIVKIQETPVKRLCKTHNIITVNGQYPGPTLEVREGDTLVINVVNRAQYNATIHWYVRRSRQLVFSTVSDMT